MRLHEPGKAKTDRALPSNNKYNTGYIGIYQLNACR